MVNRELMHWGIKGMRWGVRRYQRKDGSLTRAGKKRQAQNLEKARLAKLAKKQHDEDKQRALKSGSASEVLKYRGELTKQEMDAAWARIQWEQNMSGVASKEVSSGKARADKFFNTMSDVTNKANEAAKTWNTIANVVNAFNGRGIVLPKVDTNITSGNKDAVDKAKKEKRKAEEAAEKRKEQEAQRESKQKERAAKKAAENESKVYEGTVEGEGASKRRDTSERKSTSNKDIIDVDYVDVTPMSNVRNSAQVSIGQNYVAGLLEDKKK